jgi:hypothetical protein
MKNYFNVKIPINKEFMQMRRIAIKKLSKEGKTNKEIGDIIGISPINVCNNKKREIDSEIELKFNEMVKRKLYPIKVKSKVKWINI